MFVRIKFVYICKKRCMLLTWPVNPGSAHRQESRTAYYKERELDLNLGCIEAVLGLDGVNCRLIELERKKGRRVRHRAALGPEPEVVVFNLLLRRLPCLFSILTGARTSSRRPPLS